MLPAGITGTAVPVVGGAAIMASLIVAAAVGAVGSEVLNRRRTREDTCTCSDCLRDF